ncbi:FitA-like ribbon-helix-helix domain-containing protein [Microbacterium sp.]|uniref:FitA-like ribbon-helix-helix domain-containing protein n=1 Tax=Microbacterium sp. TaxID=51671 RepID=UPI0039E22F77
MATVTIRDLDDEVKRRLRVRAAEKGVSMEAEVRSILAEAVRDQPADEPGAWYRRMRERLEQTGAWWDDDVDALLPDRTSHWAVSPEDVARDRAAGRIVGPESS